MRGILISPAKQKFIDSYQSNEILDKKYFPATYLTFRDLETVFDRIFFLVKIPFAIIDLNLYTFVQQDFLNYTKLLHT